MLMLFPLSFSLFLFFFSIKDFVQPIKSPQAALMLHRTKQIFTYEQAPSAHSQFSFLSFPNSLSHTLTHTPRRAFVHTMNHTSEDLEKQSKVLDIDELENEKVHEEQEKPEQNDVWTWKGKTWKQRLAFLTRKEFLRVLILGQSKSWACCCYGTQIPKFDPLIYRFIFGYTVLSLCITGTVVVNNKLTEEFNFNAPTTQTFLV